MRGQLLGPVAPTLHEPVANEQRALLACSSLSARQFSMGWRSKFPFPLPTMSL